MLEEEEEKFRGPYRHWSLPQSRQPLARHINDWAANDDWSIIYVTSSLEADSDVTYSVIHYILHHVLRAMDACMEILPFLIDFDYYPMQLWEKTFGRRGFSQYRIW